MLNRLSTPYKSLVIDPLLEKLGAYPPSYRACYLQITASYLSNLELPRIPKFTGILRVAQVRASTPPCNGVRFWMSPVLDGDIRAQTQRPSMLCERMPGNSDDCIRSFLPGFSPLLGRGKIGETEESIPTRTSSLFYGYSRVRWRCQSEFEKSR